MNKNSKSLISVYIIAAIIYIIAFFAIPFPKNAASYVAFIFTVISLAVSAGILLYVLGKDDDIKSKFYGFPLMRIALIYPLIQFALGIVIFVIAAFVNLPYWVALVFSLVLLGIAAIGLIAAETTRETIKEQEVEIERTTKAVKLFNLNIASLIDFCDKPEVKKALQKLAEDFRFSDPVSSDATENSEKVIAEKLNNLKLNIKSLSADEALEAVEELKILLAERNRICKANK